MGKRNKKRQAVQAMEAESNAEISETEKEMLDERNRVDSTASVDQPLEDELSEQSDSDTAEEFEDLEDLEDSVSDEPGSPDDISDSDAESSPTDPKFRLKDAALNVEANVRKSGVIYLSTIPPGMNVSKLREIMSQYGAIGRIYLEPDQKGRLKRKRKDTDTVKHGQKYLEGWLEFKKKATAKMVAARLNNCQVGGKRRAAYFESLWNIKYLNRFKWNHLTERLVHEKMTRQHRLRQEIGQAKRQSNFFTQNIEKSKMLERIKSKKSAEGSEFVPLKKLEIHQRLTDEEIRSQPKEARKNGHSSSSSGTGINSVLANLFPKR